MILVSGSFMHVHLTLHCQIHESEHVCEYATFSMLALHVVTSAVIGFVHVADVESS